MNQPQQSTAQNIVQHPVAVIGAGPIGLAAAANAADRGIDFVVLEAGPVAGATVSEWAHVRLFSAWRELVDPAARRLLEAGRRLDRPGRGRLPDRRRVARGLPAATGRPPRRRRGSGPIRSTGRRSRRAGRDLLVDSGRESDPFTVHVATAAGERATARPRGRRRLRHLDPAEPTGRRRLPRDSANGARRTDRLRHP